MSNMSQDDKYATKEIIGDVLLLIAGIGAVWLLLVCLGV